METVEAELQFLKSSIPLTSFFVYADACFRLCLELFDKIFFKVIDHVRSMPVKPNQLQTFDSSHVKQKKFSHRCLICAST